MIAASFYMHFSARVEKQSDMQKDVMVVMRGYNMVDLSEGYLRLIPDWEKTDCSQFENATCPMELFAYSYRYYLAGLEDMNVNFAKISNLAVQTELEFIINGKANPVVKDLYINGYKWQEWFRQFVKRP